MTFTKEDLIEQNVLTEEQCLVLEENDCLDALLLSLDSMITISASLEDIKSIFAGRKIVSVYTAETGEFKEKKLSDEKPETGFFFVRADSKMSLENIRKMLEDFRGEDKDADFIITTAFDQGYTVGAKLK